MVCEAFVLVNDIAVWQSRIYAMCFRWFALVAVVVFSAGAVLGCGVRDEGDGATAELVVLPTATAEATATPEPTAVVVPTAENRSVNIANRGYNSYGDADAPITMFDFSDFL